MFNFKTFVCQALLAAALALTGAAALAGPTYLVTINTQDLEEETGLIDFSFYTTADAVGGMVSLSNFSGAFGEEFDRGGSADGAIPGAVTLVNGITSNYLTQNVTFGGAFSFNVTFSGDYETVRGLNATTFTVSLFGPLFSPQFGDAVSFDLIPAFNHDPAGVLVTIADPDLASATELVAAEVPEPSQLPLMLSAVVLAGVAMGRRKSL